MATREPSTTEKTSKTSSEMNLTLGRLQPNNCIVQIEDSSFTISGDVGTIGRMKAASADDFLIDIKGHLYKGQVVPSRTMMVLNVGGTDAKVESVINDFVECTYTGNIFDSEHVDGNMDFDFEHDAIVMSDEDEEEAPKATKSSRSKSSTAKTTKTTKTTRSTKSTTKTTKKPKKKAKLEESSDEWIE
ncbi:hypothetical protein P9112_013785 [Eukaryota sp. TZLM1-RC]